MSALTVKNTHAMECARIQMVHSLVIVLGVAKEMHLMQNATKIPSLSEHEWPLVRALSLKLLHINFYLWNLQVHMLSSVWLAVELI